LLNLGTVESIVIDLTCNGGGNTGITYQILGFLTDDPIGTHQKNITSGATESWYLSTENEAADVDWYILSSGVTFSAANLMTSIAKDMGIATIVGQQSSGGTCGLAVIATPDGSALLISSTGMLTDSRYDSIESGIEVDYYMENVNSDSELIAIINGN
jgi:C-terminal processing protease CtpA/Prc